MSYPIVDDVATDEGPWELFATYQPHYVVIGHDMEVVYSQQGHNDSAIRSAIESALEEMRIATDVESEGVPVSTWRLSNAYPNPFNPQTTISYTVGNPSDVTLRIYDLRGRLVREVVSGYHEVGEYTVRWDGRNTAGERVASGVYLYRLESMRFAAQNRVVLIR